MKTEIVWDFFFCWFLPIGLMSACVVAGIVILMALFEALRR
jgi:hypothetical protein